MNNIFENFDPNALFSAENPLVKSAQKTHSLMAEAFDKTARMQLAFGEELLDLNKKRFASLYADTSVVETLATHQDLLADASNRTAELAEGLQKIATDIQTGITDAANEWMTVAAESVQPTKATKTTKTSKKAA